MLSLRPLALLVSSVAFGAIVTGCSGTASVPPAPAAANAQTPAFTQPQSITQKSKEAALYVSDTIGKSVFRFVLNSNGTLQSPAGSSLVLPYNPFAIAVEGGNLYVTNQVNNSVEVYKAGSTGSAKAKRTILLAFEPTSVAVDASGYEYVGGSTNGYVAVFAPGAKGSATPLQEISLPDRHPTINGVAVDGSGNLYISDTNEVSVFTTPETNPTLSRAIIGSGQQNGPTGMAIDTHGENYVANFGDSNVLAYSPAANGTSGPDRTIFSSGPALIGPVGDAVKGDDLYVTSGNPLNGPASVFVFNSQKAEQTPIQVVTGSYLAEPVGAALGP
jgi:sugar lactone lactonase YvrE